jgi:hypothetical protein
VGYSLCWLAENWKPGTCVLNWKSGTHVVHLVNNGLKFMFRRGSQHFIGYPSGFQKLAIT